MHFRGNEPLHETPRPDADQREVRYPREAKPEDFSTMEVIAERENDEENPNIEALERTSRDFWGRSSEETDGAVPAEPPDTDPLELQKPEKPTGPPAHNM